MISLRFPVSGGLVETRKIRVGVGADMSFFRTKILLCGFAAISIGMLSAASANPPELIERGALRVCADGNNLPFSNQAGEGFENKIAELMAEDLDLPLTYVWAPQVMGFVRNTLELRICDVIIGIVAGYGLVQNTNSYYRSTYSVVLPADSTFEPNSLKDDGFRGLRVGVVHDTPAMMPLRGSGANIELYRAHTDTRTVHPVRDAIKDVAAGETDAAVIWGPIAGYFAARQDPPLKVYSIAPAEAGDARLDYRITMGIRRNEPQWKDWINDFISRYQNEINDILHEYEVPLLDERGNFIQASSDDGKG